MADMSIQPQVRGIDPSKIMTYAGGAVSLALVAAVAVWGVKLVMRDVSGIPVVRAAEGAIRVAPETPGGQISGNAGLSVNAVAAEGIAQALPDSVLLAPGDGAIPAEDLDVTPIARAEPSPVDVAQTAPGDVDTMAIVDQIIADADGAALTPSQTDDTDRVTIRVNGQPVETRRVAEAVPAQPSGATTLRPRARPRVVAAAAPTPAADPVAVAIASGVEASSSGVKVLAEDALPSGTRLAQLGAFDKPEVALREGNRLSARFADYFGDREVIVQKGIAGGKTFYRLRVKGFDNRADARRFCSAIEAGGVDCIPLVIR